MILRKELTTDGASSEVSILAAAESLLAGGERPSVADIVATATLIQRNQWHYKKQDNLLLHNTCFVKLDDKNSIPRILYIYGDSIKL